MKKYELTHGTCETCCFRKGIHGVSICKREEYTECTPGITCYKEVPATNGDRIRAMSNEELAEFLEENSCPPGCWLGWLKREVKED